MMLTDLRSRSMSLMTITIQAFDHCISMSNSLVLTVMFQELSSGNCWTHTWTDGRKQRLLYVPTSFKEGGGGDNHVTKTPCIVKEMSSRANVILQQKMTAAKYTNNDLLCICHIIL